jgi:ABC-2 type transport system permease protein
MPTRLISSDSGELRRYPAAAANAAHATEPPSRVMMLSNLVLLPLMFVSGVFVPHAEMPSWDNGSRPCPLCPIAQIWYGSDSVKPLIGQFRQI